MSSVLTRALARCDEACELALNGGSPVRAAWHEWLDLHQFESIAHAQLLATQWLRQYNHERPNSTARPATQKLVRTLLSTCKHLQQSCHTRLGILRLGQSYGEFRREAACQRALMQDQTR